MDPLVFNKADAQTWETVMPIFSHMLGPSKEKLPITVNGASDLADAQAWLRAQHQLYLTALGPKRSPLLRSIDPIERAAFPQFP